jgi:glycosyltransferase involved in cell wall biosynthesis
MTSKADLLWIYAELFPYLPGQFERLARAARKPIVYDLDDAFFEMYEAKPFLRGKLEPLLRSACACCAGNAYLRDYAARHCRRSIILPTVVNTDVYKPNVASGAVPVIGWIGSPSTWSFVKPLLPVLRSVVEAGKARVRIVGAGASASAHGSDGIDLIEWSEESEVADVQAMNIGIMPLPDNRWAEGKSGYKLVQYMACGLPVVASPVGVNREIVTEGWNGFLPDSLSQWSNILGRLLADPSLRERLGNAGRERAVADYSLKVHGPRLVEVMRTCVATS